MELFGLPYFIKSAWTTIPAGNEPGWSVCPVPVDRDEGLGIVIHKSYIFAATLPPAVWASQNWAQGLWVSAPDYARVPWLMPNGPHVLDYWEIEILQMGAGTGFSLEKGLGRWETWSPPIPYAYPKIYYYMLTSPGITSYSGFGVLWVQPAHFTATEWDALQSAYEGSEQRRT